MQPVEQSFEFMNTTQKTLRNPQQLPDYATRVQRQTAQLQNSVSAYSAEELVVAYSQQRGRQRDD